MELNDLEHHERVVLVALLKFAVLSDGVATEQEADAVHAIAEQMGEEAYQKARDAAWSDARTLDDVVALLPSVERAEAREVIYGSLLEASIEDSVDVGEARLLDLVQKAWGIEVSYDAEELAEGDDD